MSQRIRGSKNVYSLGQAHLLVEDLRGGKVKIGVVEKILQVHARKVGGIRRI